MERPAPYAEYLDDIDILFVALSDEPVVRSGEAGSVWINVDYDAAGHPVAVEFVNASTDADLGAVPCRDLVEQQIAAAGLPFAISGDRLVPLAQTL